MRRIAIATAGSLLALLALALVLDLPDPVAVRFSPDGTPDGFATRTAALILLVAIPGIVAMLMLALTWTSRLPPEGMRWPLGLPVGMVWGVGGVVLATLVPQAGLADARDAQVDPSWIMVALAVGVVTTFLGSRLTDLDDPTPTTEAPPQSDRRANLSEGSTVLWTGQAPDAPVPFVLALALLLAGLLIGPLVAWWLGLLLAAGAALLATATRFRVTIGPMEVRVHGPLAGWPRLVVPVDTITRARTSKIRPLDFGGWGLRTVPGTGATAVVTRSGPALELRRTDDTKVMVSLIEAEEAAAVLSTLLDRRASPPDPSTTCGS